MEIAILHLTDLHFKKGRNFLDNKPKKIHDAIKSELNGVEKIYITITGDIIQKGNIDGFLPFNSFLTNLKNYLDEITESMIILLPGNHDCDFSKENQARKTILKNVNYETIGTEDTSVLDLGIGVQMEFWNNYTKYSDLPNNKIFYKIEDEINGKIITFNCFNTAWMSKINEERDLFFPVKLFEIKENVKKSNLNIALLHHPIIWFKPEGIENNRKELARFVEENNSLILFGHEHEEDHRKSTEFWSNRETIYFSGKELQNDFNDQSGFNFIRINLNSKYSIISFFEWQRDLYIPKSEKDFQLNGDIQSTKRFKSKLEFLLEINKLKIPISLENDLDINLGEIYVFPDLEKNEKPSSSKLIEDLYDSENIVTDKNLKVCLIEGENQSGKTSLITMLYKKFIENDNYPLIIDGKNIKVPSIESLIKSNFDKQYLDGENVYNKYKQYNRNEKILLIDNFQDIKLNIKSLKELISNITGQFVKIIFFSDNIISLISQLKSDVEEISIFTIRPLGYKKRNKLIENYHRLSFPEVTITEHALLEKTKESFNKIEHILGNKLLPSYPIFILSILQTLSYARNSSLDQTSYGHCYHSLIYLALAKKAKIENELIDSYFNFLAGFSLFLYQKNKTVFYESDLEKYYNIYSKEFHLGFSYETLKNKLIDSKLIGVNDDDWFFTYKYIYYFLVAKKVSESLSKEEGKKAVQYLCANLHKDKDANILIFIAHHTKDDFLIQEATFTAMVPFENVIPITLNKNGHYYNLIKDIVKEISSNVIESTINPVEHREKILEDKDKNERNQEIKKKEQEDMQVDDENISESMAEFYKSFRALEIVGQIIKNRKGSIPTEQLITMIMELYLTAFRTISFSGINLNSAKDSFIEAFSEKVKPGTSKREVEEKINNFFQFLSFQICLGVFTKVIHSVGQKDLKELFIEAASRINTPAADLVTFSINSYYGNLSKNELREITKKYEHNIVAMQIIKSRVKSFLYQNFVDIKKKQAFASILKMQLKSTAK